MSPRAMASSVVKVFDLKDPKNPERYAFGKTMALGLVVVIITAHFLRNPFSEIMAAILLSFIIGPGTFTAWLNRTSFTLQKSSTQQAAGGGVVSEQVTQKSGNTAPPVASNRDPVLDYEPTP